MKTLPSLALLGLGSLLASPAASAQTPIHSFEGYALFDMWGLALGSGGDIDADGVPDILVGGYRGDGFSGRARAYSGATGALLHEIVGNPGDWVGVEVEILGDTNGDGHAEYGVARNGGIDVYSGATHGLLYTVAGGGYAFDATGDVNADGAADFIAVESVTFNVSTANVYSGVDGSILAQVPGTFVTGIGDVNGDGHAEFVAATPYQVVTVYDGATYGALVAFAVGDINQLHDAGDVDADGVPDLLLDGWGTEYVSVLSGVDGSQIFTLPAEETSNVWQYTASVGDVNLDGHADVLVLNDLYSGATGRLLLHFEVTQGGPHGVAGVGDVDGDGLPDVAFGNGLPVSANGYGLVEVFRAAGGLGTSYCVSTPNSTGNAATIYAAGSASVSADDLILAVEGAPPLTFGLFVYGGAQAQFPAGNGFFCLANGQTGIHRLFPPALSNQGGFMLHPVDIQSPPTAAAQITAGSTWNFQAWYRDIQGMPTTYDFTDALEIVFVP